MFVVDVSETEEKLALARQTLCTMNCYMVRSCSFSFPPDSVLQHSDLSQRSPKVPLLLVGNKLDLVLENPIKLESLAQFFAPNDLVFSTALSL